MAAAKAFQTKLQPALTRESLCSLSLLRARRRSWAIWLRVRRRSRAIWLRDHMPASVSPVSSFTALIVRDFPTLHRQSILLLSSFGPVVAYLCLRPFFSGLGMVHQVDPHAFNYFDSVGFKDYLRLSTKLFLPVTQSLLCPSYPYFCRGASMLGEL